MAGVRCLPRGPGLAIDRVKHETRKARFCIHRGRSLMSPPSASTERLLIVNGHVCTSYDSIHRKHVFNTFGTTIIIEEELKTIIPE